MSSYRFCRTDDISLLVDALNRCWRPWFSEEPPMTVARFKREIRDLQVWCSSCMVAFAGDAPVAVMIGAKRTAATLVHRIAVHPDHVREGHGRHLLTSLSSKLSILGPPRIVAEIPGADGPAHDLFASRGFTREATLTDVVLDPCAAREAISRDANTFAPPGRLVIPVSVDDLAANGLLAESHPHLCWERSVETLTARKSEIGGLAVATDEQIEAHVLYEAEADERGTRILAIRSHVPDDGERVRLLTAHLVGAGRTPLRISKLHHDEIGASLAEGIGFRPEAAHVRYAAVPRAA